MVFGGQAGPPRGSQKLDLQPELLGRAFQGDLPRGWDVTLLSPRA